MVDIFPYYKEIFWYKISNTTIALIITNIVFLMIVIFRKNLLIELFFEKIYNFYSSIWEWLSRKIILFVVWIFYIIFISNVIWVFVDLFAHEYLIYKLHYLYRPVWSDIIFNLILAFIWIWVAFIYWIKTNWIKFFLKYFPIYWIWLVKWKSIFKIFDIMIWLFIWLLELISEIIRILSLAIRLFSNILAWMIFIMLSISGAVYLFKVPFGLPILVIWFELFVAFIQAFVFALIVLISFILNKHH